MTDNNTVNVSKMTDEQVRALLDGTLSWDDAAALSPGPAVSITDWFVDTTEFNNGTVVEQHQTDERMAIIWCYPKGDFLLQFCEKDKKGEYRVRESTRRFKTRGTIDLKVREWLEETC